MESLQQNKGNDLVNKMLHKLFKSLNNDESRKYIQIYLIDPLMNHVLERIFPYIIITSVLFIILILCIITICVFIYYNIKNGKIV
jgi:hypothetical protein